MDAATVTQVVKCQPLVILKSIKTDDHDVSEVNPLALLVGLSGNVGQVTDDCF